MDNTTSGGPPATTQHIPLLEHSLYWTEIKFTLDTILIIIYFFPLCNQPDPDIIATSNTSLTEEEEEIIGLITGYLVPVMFSVVVITGSVGNILVICVVSEGL